MVLSFNQYMGYLYGVGAAILLVIAIAYYLIIWKDQDRFEIIIALTLKIKTYNCKLQAPTPIQTLTATTRSLAVKTDSTTTTSIKDSPPTDKKYLDLYGKIIRADSFRNKLFLAIIIVVLVFTATVAFYQQTFLGNTTVYPGDPCPSNFIQMDCYFGSEQTYFNCTQGQQTDPKFVNGSAMCFHWRFHDISVNDVLTTFGACAGLLNAFFAMTQVLLYYLIHCSAKILVYDHDNKNETSPKYVAKYKMLHCINIVLFGLLVIIVIVGAILLSVFKISTTVVTYVILATIPFVMSIAFVWTAEIATIENDPDVKNLAEAIDEIKKLAQCAQTIGGVIKRGT